LEQLKGATAEQRQQILEKLQAQKKELDTLQREQGKQLREELRKLRQSSPAPRK
jgi:cell division protein FtsB